MKAEFLTRSAESFPNQFQLIETLLWQDGFPLLSFHLDRLEDLANYFGFACERAEVEDTLLAQAREFACKAPRKVRLLLARDGGLEVAAELLPRSAGAVKAARGYIAITNRLARPDALSQNNAPAGLRAKLQGGNRGALMMCSS